MDCEAISHYEIYCCCFFTTLDSRAGLARRQMPNANYTPSPWACHALSALHTLRVVHCYIRYLYIYVSMRSMVGV